MSDPDVIIVGAGFAGAATAYHLAREGRGALIVEREPSPGQWASGRNAGMIRTLMTDPETQRMALDSVSGLEALGDDLLRRTGGLILASADDAASLRPAAERSCEAGREVIEAPRAPAGADRWLADARFEACFETPADGIADVHGLLHAFLAEARRLGVSLRTGTEVFGLAHEDGRVTGVVTSEGVIRGGVVVNAAGAWAGEVGAPGAAEAIGVRPMKRHLHSTGPVPDADPDLPFIWHDTTGYYFRPESGGFLLSGCDHTEDAPGEPLVDPEVEERLAAKLVTHVPALADLPIATRWACHRTFTRDDRFAIGWDPGIEGLYWVAGLGGHGVTVSHAVGSLAAREILAGRSESPFAPSRFG